MGPPPAEPLLAWLAVVDGPGAPRGQVFSLQPETTIGRTAGQIVLGNDPYVSAQHAKIRQEPSEDDPDVQVIALYDLASANGSFAGSEDDYRDQQVYRHELQDGDYLLIGETTLVFKKV
jgi:pSer/pThr/pTyr-binding forkhead associated (FHA) protein